MTEKIKEIVDQFLEDRKEYQSSYKYRLNHSYYIKFQHTVRTDCIRVTLGVELPGYERQTSDVYKFSPYRLSSDDEGLSALIYMQYKEIEETNKDSVSVGYNLYKSVLSDNDRLRDQIKQLEKDVETWKQSSIENHKAYLSAMKGYEEYQDKYLLEQKRRDEWHDKYIDEKMDHTKTEARIVFAKHILSGNRDEKVKEHLNAIEHFNLYGM